MKPNEILRKVDHRPYPLPKGPWVMRQTWNRLLFAHWPLPPEDIHPLLPAGLELDTFAGDAYISMLPFRMTGVRVRALPYIPGTTSMLQINVRTYVRHGGVPGVYFLSLDTNHVPTVIATRIGLGLPYFHAHMEMKRRFVGSREQIEFHSRRSDAGTASNTAHATPAAHATEASSAAGRLEVSYYPTSTAKPATPGSLAHWLVERYCLYNQHIGKLLRVDIHHHPWLLQDVFAEYRRQSLLEGRAIEKQLTKGKGIPIEKGSSSGKGSPTESKETPTEGKRSPTGKVTPAEGKGSPTNGGPNHQTNLQVEPPLHPPHLHYAHRMDALMWLPRML